MGSTVLSAHGLARQEICSFVHLVVRLGMLFTKKLFKTWCYIPVKNKHVNHFYIAIRHISVLCLTVFEIIPTTQLHMHAWSCQMICCFSIGMRAGTQVEEVHVDMQMAVMKELSSRWFVSACDHIQSNPDIVKNGFKKAGITEALEKGLPEADAELDF